MVNVNSTYMRHTPEQWEEARRGATKFAGREVTEDEVFLFLHFGTTNLTEVPRGEFDELEALIDTSLGW